MSIWGKLIGAFLGYLMGGFWGLLLGVWLGNRLDQRVSSNSQNYFFSSTNGKEKQRQFFASTFAVMGHLAKSKGQVTETDIEIASAYMTHMRLHGEARQHAQNSFSKGKQSIFSLESEIASFKDHIGPNRNVMQMFLSIQIQVAYSDGVLHRNEKAILERIAQGLGFSLSELARLLKMAEGQQHFHQGNQQNTTSKEDAYKILGVSESSTDKEIKRAYRREMSQNHPDKLLSKGLPEEMMNIAKEKTQDIQKAYESLRKIRGFK